MKVIIINIKIGSIYLSKLVRYLEVNNHLTMEIVHIEPIYGVILGGQIYK